MFSRHIKTFHIWELAYLAFISIILLVWVEKSDTTQIVAVGFGLCVFFTSLLKYKYVERFCLITLLILFNPLLSAIIFPLESKGYKALVFFVLFLWWLFTDLKKLKQLFKILTVCNVLFVCFLISKYYLASWDFNQVDGSPPIARYITPKDAENDIYILIFDAFSNNRILKKYAGEESRFQNFLLKEGFVEYPSLSKYYYTDRSLPNIFSGVNFQGDTRFTSKFIDKMQDLVPGTYIKDFTKKHGYNLTVNSLLIEPENNQLRRDFGKGGDIPLAVFSPINRLFKFVGFTPKEDDNLEISEISERNYSDIQNSFKLQGKQLGIFHYLTFHMSIFDKSFKESLKISLKEADEVGIKAVQMILKNKPSAKIIVLSDHGERNNAMLESEYTQGILFIKK